MTSPVGWVGTRADGSTVVFAGAQPNADYASQFTSLAEIDTAVDLDAAIAASRTVSATATTTPATLLAYANQKQWAVATGGYTTTIGGQSLTFPTDSSSQSLLTGKTVRLALANPPTTVVWQFASGFVSIAAADFLSATIKIADFVQSTFGVLQTLEAAIAASPPTVTTRAEIDAAFAALT